MARLILGFAQQTFTGMLDRQAQSLLTSLPATDATAAGAPPAQAVVVAPAAPAVAADAPSIVDPAAVSGIPDQREYDTSSVSGGTHAAVSDEPEYLPPPPDPASIGVPTEDDSPVLPNAIETANP